MYILCYSSELVASYSYDGWGNCTVEDTSTNQIGYKNPLRYRSYYYDSETGYYYLNSRYYDSEVGRFISADDTTNLGANNDYSSLNLYVYCGNNPINRKDVSGNCWGTTMLVGALINVTLSFISATATGQEFSFQDAIIAAAIGSIPGIPAVSKYTNILVFGFSTMYSAYSAHSSGATFSESLICGVVSGVATTITLGNLANSLSISLVEDAYLVFSDCVFGAAVSLMDASITASIISNSSKEKNNSTVTKNAPKGSIASKTGSRFILDLL